MKAKEVVEILKRNGFLLDRQSGSHMIFKKEDKTVVVPNHGKKDLKKGTLAEIFRQAGIKK